MMLTTILCFLYSFCIQVGNDIRQVLHAMQMWRAKSKNMRYTELKDGMQRIEKDKVYDIFYHYFFLYLDTYFYC